MQFLADRHWRAVAIWRRPLRCRYSLPQAFSLPALHQMTMGTILRVPRHGRLNLDDPGRAVLQVLCSRTMSSASSALSATDSVSLNESSTFLGSGSSPISWLFSSRTIPP